MKGYKIYTSIVLYGCGTWSLVPRKTHILRVFENEVLRKMFRSRKGEVTKYWRKLYNEDLHTLHSSHDTVSTFLHHTHINSYMVIITMLL
jgi:hypothetical protein